MPQQEPPPPFAVISGAEAQRVLAGRHRAVVELVESAYRMHGKGETVNPPSYFLRFPDRPAARIIALPASLGGPDGVDGLKWISSFPVNVANGLPRASAVLILNDPRTGYPFACMEGSIISATRTAASAALAADWLVRSAGRSRPRRLGIVGAGLIARYVCEYLAATGWTFEEIGVHDTVPEHAAGFRGFLDRSLHRWAGRGAAEPRVSVQARVEDLVRGSDLIVFATVAAGPYVTEPSWFHHRPLVLNISLRDLSPQVVLAAANVVDDVEHCLTAGTSVHLAEQRTGGRAFLDGTLADVMTGRVRLPGDRPVIFSPFGLGVLDLAVGRHVYDELRARGALRTVDGFFHELRRYG